MQYELVNANTSTDDSVFSASSLLKVILELGCSLLGLYELLVISMRMIYLVDIVGIK